MIPTQLSQNLGLLPWIKKRRNPNPIFCCWKLTLFMQFVHVPLKLFKTLSCRPGFCIDWQKITFTDFTVTFTCYTAKPPHIDK